MDTTSAIIIDDMEFIKIKPGIFKMGSNADDEYATDMEVSRKVNISIPYYLLKTPVTVGQYRKYVECERVDTSYLIEKWDGVDWVIGPYFDEINTLPNFPVVGVSYYDAIHYIEWLKKQYSYSFRLPTEAEFEFAARSGCQCKKTCKYATIARTMHYDRKEDELPRQKAFPVEKMIENKFGLYGMHCSVWQWCSDWYYYYEISQDIITNPHGPKKMPEYAPWNGEKWRPGKVIRGGSFSYPFYHSRCSDRHYSLVTDRNYNVGFRVAI